MARREHNSPLLVATKIALVYAVFGTLWIVFSDRLVAQISTSEAQLTFLQTVKGGGFVGVSALILFGMVYWEHRHLATSNEDLDSALQQVHILHRILRHNLRNICSIIGGTIDKVDTDTDGQSPSPTEVLRRQNERLINLSNKSRYLKEFLLEETDRSRQYDLVELVEIEVEKAREKYPDSRIYLEPIARADVYAHYLLNGAIEELIENAIEHNPAADPRVWLTVDEDRQWVTLTVEDDGPGVPSSEQSALRSKYETPLDHSQGLGLWLVHLTIRESRGQLEIDKVADGGAKILVKLPRVR